MNGRYDPAPELNSESEHSHAVGWSISTWVAGAAIGTTALSSALWVWQARLKHQAKEGGAVAVCQQASAAAGEQPALPLTPAEGGRWPSGKAARCKISRE